MKELEYSSYFSEIESIEDDEKYALLSHAIQLKGREEAHKYVSLLKQYGICIDNLTEKGLISKDNQEELDPKGKKFTFIDLFAGIGGFRLAMQDVGGLCVFSSEWDEAAKLTYFQNYGEVPFGDITKPEIKAVL